MNAATLHYCPLCRTPHPSYGAVRAHLIVDHKRKMIEADVLLVKCVDLTKPIPERRIDAAQVSRSSRRTDSAVFRQRSCRPCSMTVERPSKFMPNSQEHREESQATALV
jgi:hypothetical protein